MTSAMRRRGPIPASVSALSSDFIGIFSCSSV
jgi:hypothetical protein